MAKNEKSKAEIYREERKERIAKANKKNARGIEAGKTAGNILRKVVAVVLVAAIVCGIGYYALKTSGLVERFAPAVKFSDGTKVSASDFNYYYSSLYSATLQMAQYYSQYGYSYDTNKAPDEQTTTDEEGNEVTYAEYFRTSAVDRIQYIEAYYQEAMKAGFEVDEDVKKEIDETVQSYKDSASESGYSLSAFLKANFGAGLNEKKFRALVEKQEVAGHYNEFIQDKFAKDVAEDEVNKEYKENRKLYDYVDIRYYTVSGDTLTAEEGESDKQLKARQDKADKEVYADAEAILSKATSADAFEAAIADYEAKKSAEEDAAKADDAAAAETAEAAEETAAEDKKEEEEEKTYSVESNHAKYDSFKSATSEKAADWAFDSARKAGNVSKFEDGSKAYIVYIVKPIYSGHSVNVRHLLVKFSDSEDTSAEPTADQKKAALEKAQGYLADFKNGEQTEDDFAALAKQYTEDTGSADNGGLYEKMRITDSYVEPFLNWSFDPARKAGDVEIVESQYGYHIMYFCSDNTDDTDWADAIRTNLGTTAFNDYNDKLLSDDDGSYKPEVSDYWTNYVTKRFCDKIKRNNALSA